MDWAELLMSSISSLANLIMAAAAVAAAIAAWNGLNTWKVQNRWQADHDLARSLLLALFKHKDAIAVVRNPAMFRHEMEAAVEGQERADSEKEQRFNEIAAVYQKRWEKVTAAQQELYPLLMEAEVIWGPELKQLIKPLNELEVELQMYIRTDLMASNPQISKGHKEAAERRLEKIRDVLYADFSEDDVFYVDYKRAIAQIEDYLRDKLGRKV